jgi:hypothetical protein
MVVAPLHAICAALGLPVQIRPFKLYPFRWLDGEKMRLPDLMDISLHQAVIGVTVATVAPMVVAYPAPST